MRAGSDAPSPDGPGDLRPSSGPADVPVALLVAARNGDAGAFARFVEHWDVHLRPFVQHTLAGDGSTDRVLSAAYVRAFRALPRYRAAQTPGLWLHRVAYLAVVDELRRLTRDPMRRRARAHPPAPTGPAADAAPLDPVVVALRRLAPDQRALAILVDLEGFHPEAVAAAFDTAEKQVASRLGSARRVLLRAAPATGAGAADEPVDDPAPAVAPDAADPLAAPLAELVDPAAPAPDPDPSPEPGAEPEPGAGPEGAAVDPRRAGSLGAVRAHPTAVGLPGGAGPAEAGPDTPSTGAGDPFAVPSWALDPGESVTVVVPDPPVPVPVSAAPDDRAAADDADPEAVRALLAGLAISEPAPEFWGRLGTLLLAERERPAAPTPDPVARLARAHPAEPSFRPSQGPANVSVTDIASQLRRTRPRRRWGRPLVIAAGVLAVAALVAGAVAIGTSGRTPDGTVSGAEVAAAMAGAFDANRYLTARAEVEEPVEVGGRAGTAGYRLTLAQDGSWLVSRTDTYDQATFDSASGTGYRLAVLPGEAGGPPVALAGEDRGLATGGPDPEPDRLPLLEDLAAIGPLLRAEGGRRARPTDVGGVETWTYERTVASGPSGADERWTVDVRRSDGLPVRIERRRGDDLVRRTRFAAWKPASDVASGTFQNLVLPAGTTPSTTEHGFVRGDLADVALLGAGDAITPAWLPEGFELASVALLAEAPAGATTTGGGRNPPDEAVASFGYQRGPEHITVTTRTTTAPASDWTDPFAAAEGDEAGDAPTGTGTTRRRTLGDGHFNQVPVRITTDAVGRAQLWGISDGTVFTVGGDLTAAEAFRVAASLR